MSFNRFFCCRARSTSVTMPAAFFTSGDVICRGTPTDRIARKPSASLDAARRLQRDQVAKIATTGGDDGVHARRAAVRRRFQDRDDPRHQEWVAANGRGDQDHDRHRESSRINGIAFAPNFAAAAADQKYVFRLLHQARPAQAQPEPEQGEEPPEPLHDRLGQCGQADRLQRESPARQHQRRPPAITMAARCTSAATACSTSRSAKPPCRAMRRSSRPTTARSCASTR